MTDVDIDRSDVGTQVLTFVIADVRGYTRFTREHGDAAAAELARRFAEVARDSVEARGGQVIELRGDEALAVFTAPAQALLAAVELQLTCAEEFDADPAFPLLVGVGMDMGPAVPVEDGFRGVALNLSARLCSAAGAGQVLLTTRTLDAIGKPPRRVTIASRGPMTFKGFDELFDVVEATATAAIPRPRRSAEAAAEAPVAPTDEAPLVGRVRELRWLRGTWRQVHRGNGRIVVVSGVEGIGKTRLATAVMDQVTSVGGRARYVGGGGTAAAAALTALREVRAAATPTLLVLDDVDAIAIDVANVLHDAWDELEQKPVLVVVLARDTDANVALGAVAARADAHGDGHRALAPLEADDVRAIVATYAGPLVAEAPVESIVRSSHGVPARVHELASEWARSEATRRLEAAAEFLAAVRDQRTADLDFANNVIGLRLGRLFAGDSGSVVDEGQCPYKGLAAFDEADATWFFGRERLVGELAARLVGNGLLSVVGASGSGKSSVLAAGLLPSLTAGLLPGSERWHACTMRPGEHPLDAARAALDQPAEDPLAAAIGALDDGGRLVLVVDQFEEVFTTCLDEDERAQFLDLLARGATADVERCVVVVAVRSDFYGHIAAHPDLASLFRDNHVLVPPMSRDELHRVVALPARRAGARVEAALADALVAEAADEPGALPLLSTALVELWQTRDDGWLRLAAYRDSGGIHGAVARLAEGSYAELSDAEHTAARRVMLRLAATGDGDAVTRRRVAVDEFDLERDELARSVIERFIQDRLLTSEEDTIEVAHEALLREWPRLRVWLDEDAQGRQVRQHLTQAARTWDTTGREPSEQYRGARLTVTLDWASDHAADLNDLERDFLAASRQAADQDAATQRRTNRRLRSLLSGVALLLVLALIAGVLAFVQRGSARRSAHHAQRAATSALAQSLGAQAVAQPRIDLAMLLAREAVALDPSAQTRADLFTTLMRAPSALRTYHWNADRNNGVAVSPDGKTLAIADNNGNWIWRDVATGSEVRHNSDNFLAFAPDGRIVDGTSSGGLVLRDGRTYAVMRRLAPPALARGGGDIGVLGFADHGRVVIADVTRSQDTGRGPVTTANRIVRIKLATGRSGHGFSVDPSNNALIPLHNGEQLLIVTDRQTTLVDTITGQALRRYPIGNGAAAVTADDSTLALAHPTGLLQFLDLRTGKVSSAIGAIDADELQFTPDGTTLVAAGEDGAVQLWDVAARQVSRTLTGHAGPIHGMAMSPDGTTLYTGSFDTNVIGWDLTGARGLVSSYSGGDMDPQFGAWTLSISPDGRTAAEGAANGDIVLSDLVSHRQLQRFHVTDGVVSATAFAPDGRSLLVSSDQLPPSPKSKTELQIWSLSPRPHPVHSFDTGAWAYLTWATWSPDGRTIAATGYLRDQKAVHAGAVAEWDATGRALAPPLQTKGGYAIVVAFAPHGTDVAVAGHNFQSFLADPATGTVLATLKNSGGEYSQGIAYSPDGTKVATAQWDGTIRIWDARNGRQLVKIQDAGQDVVEGVAWSPDGRMLAATDWGPALRLYDIATREEIGPPYKLPALANGLQYDPWAQFTPDGSKVVVNGTNDQTFVLPVTVKAWADQACTIAGRDFTREEWAKYVPGRPYRQVCKG